MSSQRLPRITAVVIGLLAASSLSVSAQEAPSEAMAPAYFNGSSGAPMQVTEGDIEETPSGNSMSGLILEGIPFEATDPRISGTLDIRANGSGQGVEQGFARLESRTYEITNEDGSWSGSGNNVFALQAGAPAIDLETFQLAGSGAYEGLNAYVVIDFMGDTLVRGVILSQPLAAFPAE